VIQLWAICSPGEVRVAVANGEELLDFAISRPGAPDGVGDLHRGQILSVVPAMAGAFVTLAGGEGFLPDSQGAAGLTQGTVLGIRVTRAAQGGKGPRLTAKLDQAGIGRGPVALLRRGPGAVERLATIWPQAEIWVDDTGVAAALKPLLGGRVRVTRDPLPDALAGEIEALEQPFVELPGGMRLSVHATPALVAIDVDAGTMTAARESKSTAQSGLNRAVLPALARQIRLRNLSGGIVVDLAGMPARKRVALAPALAEALSGDPLRPRFLGFTALGFAEILRPRVHPPLHELLTGPHAAGLSALRSMLHNTETDPSARFALHASPAVISALQADLGALEDYTRRTGRQALLRSDPGLSMTGWRMERDPHGTT
jgi:hypothetical protein